MLRAATLISAIIVLMLHAGSAKAQGAESFGINLRATVPLFCRVRASFDTVAMDQLAGQDLELGAVDEVCNNGAGYKVSAQFYNLTSGELRVDGVPSQILSGEASYSNPQAARRTRYWSLTNMSLASADQPIRVRVSISPI